MLPDIVSASGVSPSLYLKESSLFINIDGVGYIAMWVASFSKITFCDLNIALIFQLRSLYSFLLKYPIRMTLVDFELSKNDVTVTVTGSYDIKKNIEESRISNIIQHSNNMLIL